MWAAALQAKEGFGLAAEVCTVKGALYSAASSSWSKLLQFVSVQAWLVTIACLTGLPGSPNEGGQEGRGSKGEAGSSLSTSSLAAPHVH